MKHTFPDVGIDTDLAIEELERPGARKRSQCGFRGCCQRNPVLSSLRDE